MISMMIGYARRAKDGLSAWRGKVIDNTRFPDINYGYFGKPGFSHTPSMRRG